MLVEYPQCSRDGAESLHINDVLREIKEFPQGHTGVKDTTKICAQ